MCKRDVLFWIRAFCWQYNPNAIGEQQKKGPFIPWKAQDTLILGGTWKDAKGEDVRVWGILECLNDREPMILEKSREMGASWLLLIVMAWLCLFHNDETCLAVSRDEPSVDNMDDSMALLWKVDFVHQHLPGWMRGEVRRRKMQIKDVRTNSVMVGDACTEKSLVSGRGTMALIDEFGQIDSPKDSHIFGRTADVTACRFFVGTHKGTSSMFYEICYSPKYSSLRHNKLHWTHHPEKCKGLYKYDPETNRPILLDPDNIPEDYPFVMSEEPTGGPFPGLRSPWYDKQCVQRSAADVRMDLDIDPRGMDALVFPPLMVAAHRNAYACPPYWVGDLIHNEATGEPITLVPNPTGLLKLWCIPRSPRAVPYMTCAGGADIAQGGGASNTCLSMANALGRGGEKVAEYMNNHIDPLRAATLFVALCRLFVDGEGNPAFLGWEAQGPGGPFTKRVIELGYRRIYLRRNEDALGKPREGHLKPGLNMNSMKRPLLENYTEALEKGWFINRSRLALEDTQNFIWTGKGPEYRHKGTNSEDPLNSVDNHGDIVMADAICLMMCRELNVPDARLIDSSEPVIGSYEWRVAMHEATDRASGHRRRWFPKVIG